MANKTRRSTYKGGEDGRFMIRAPNWREWQADADAEAGEADAPLGPWARMMIEWARKHRKVRR